MQNIDHLVILVRGAVSADGSSDAQKTHSVPAHGLCWCGTRRYFQSLVRYELLNWGAQDIRVALEGYTKLSCFTSTLLATRDSAAITSPTEHAQPLKFRKYILTGENKKTIVFFFLLLSDGGLQNVQASLTAVHTLPRMCFSVCVRGKGLFNRNVSVLPSEI